MKTMLRSSTAIVLPVLVCMGIATAAQSQQLPSRMESDSVDVVLKKLQQGTADLKTYQSQVQWLEEQPSFDNSRTLKTGTFYFQTDGPQSRLRLDIQTLKQDDQKEQKYVVQHIFDGVWLTVIDYQLIKFEKRQLAEEDQAGDVFELVNQYFPILGFSRIEDLREQFEIDLVRNEQAKTSNLVQLHLKVKQDSVYRDDYISIDFWIDKKLYLPVRIVAVCTGPNSLTEDERDRLEFRFLKPKVNRRLSKKTFNITPPKKFGKPEIFPLR